jgi:hypothetical protein
MQEHDDSLLSIFRVRLRAYASRRGAPVRHCRLHRPDCQGRDRPSWSLVLPPLQTPLHGFHYSGASFMTRHATCEQIVILRVFVPYVSSNGEFDRVSLKVFGRRCPPHPARVLLAGVFGNGLPFLRRATGKQFPNSLGKRADVCGIEFLPALRCTLPRQLSRVGVGQAFAFGPRERLFFDQQSLSLVAFS